LGHERLHLFLLVVKLDESGSELVFAVGELGLLALDLGHLVVVLCLALGQHAVVVLAVLVNHVGHLLLLLVVLGQVELDLFGKLGALGGKRGALNIELLVARLFVMREREKKVGNKGLQSHPLPYLDVVKDLLQLRRRLFKLALERTRRGHVGLDRGSHLARSRCRRGDPVGWLARGNGADRGQARGKFASWNSARGRKWRGRTGSGRG